MRMSTRPSQPPWATRPTDLSKLVSGDEVQDFTPGAILKGRVTGIAGDDFVVELGLKSEGVLERTRIR